MNHPRENYLERLGREIKKARARQDSLTYYLKCNEAGIDPKDTVLYEQGCVDARVSKKGLRNKC